MNRPLKHPSEEELMSFALDGECGDLAKHLEACAECARLVRDIRGLRENIRGLPEEEVPERVRRKILEGAKAKTGRPSSGRGFWWRGSFPFMVGIAVIAAALFLYFLFVYLH